MKKLLSILLVSALLLSAPIIVDARASARPKTVESAELSSEIRTKGSPGIIPSPSVIQMFLAKGSIPPRVVDWHAPTPENPVIGTRKILVIRIDFSDCIGTQSQSYFNDLVFGTSQGQMKHYFTEVSYGQLDITGTVTANWYRSAHTMVYWGSDSAYGIDDLNGPIFELAREAVLLADADINFKSYDTDDDNVLDPEELSLCIVHAGDGQESSGVSTHIWSHRWYIYGQGYSYYGTPLPDTFVDGVRVSKHPSDYAGGYFMQAETSPMGTFAHEFGHDLGLLDLYDTDYSSEGIGVWCLMSFGSWLGSPAGSCPSHPSGWSKAQLGWITPTQISPSGMPDVQVKQIETNQAQSLYRLTVTSSEYFLFENRQNTWYDLWLPGSGILVWHVDASMPDNDNEGQDPILHRLIDLEEAHGGIQHLDYNYYNSGDAGDCYSSSTTGFADTTDPNSAAYSGSPTRIAVLHISPSATDMTLDVEFHTWTFFHPHTELWFTWYDLTGPVTSEIAYDDGIPESYFSWSSAGAISAMRFTSSVSGKLQTARFHIGSDPYAFKVHVMDSNRVDKIAPFMCTPTAVGWFMVDLSGRNIAVAAGVDFYIGVEWTTGYWPCLSEDYNQPDGRSWDWDGASWEQWPYSDYLIRAVIATGGTRYGAQIDNIHFINPSASPTSITVYIGGIERESFQLASGGSTYKNYPGVIGGPVRIISTLPVWATQRIVGWNSFKEVPGLPADMAATEIYYTWYDMKYANWDAIHFLNPSTTSTSHLNIYIEGQLMPSCPISIPPGGADFTSYANKIGGPVRIASDVPILSTQRVVGWSDFDEIIGMPSWYVFNEHWFNWYDRVGASIDNIHFINPGSSTANIQVYIGEALRGSYSLNPSAASYVNYPGLIGGPVRVLSDQPIWCTQRIVGWGGFKELFSVPSEMLSDSWYFNWYDKVNTQIDNIHFLNPSGSEAYITVTIAGTSHGSFNIPAGGAYYISCPGVCNGPVMVESNVPIMASQRIVGWSSFEETLGVRWS